MSAASQSYKTYAQRGLRKRLYQCQTRLQLLKSVSSRINSGLAAPQIIERTLVEAHKSFPHLRISYASISPQQILTIMHSVAPAQMPSLLGAEWVLAEGNTLVPALEAGQIIVAFDAVNDDRLQAVTDLLSASGTRALILVPITQPGRELGVLSFAAQQPRAWDGHEIATLSDMAEYLAIALRESFHQQERGRIEQHLRDSQKVEAVGRLVGGIAHDFNNLLTGMMIYCGLLEIALGKDHRLQRHVHEIRCAGERGAELVGQLLASTSQQVLEPKVISINTVLLESQDLLRRLIREDILLDLQCDQQLQHARVDPGQLQQVILNLAINARDAMPGGGQLRILTSNCLVDEPFASAYAGLSPGQYVLLTVADNGQGIAEETRAHIFEPFFTTKSRGEGSGLGLATVDGIVKQHGGYIAVESVLGKGTTFRIFLPTATDEVDGSGVSAESPHCPSLLMPTLPAGESLLLVEDDEMVRRSLIESLRSSGYQVLEAASGHEALKISHDHHGPIPLMITDLIMPGMGGGELAQKLQAVRPETEVLYISGYTDDPRTRKLMGAGVDFLGKPFSAGVLIEKIQAILSNLKKSIALQQPSLVRFS